MFDDAIVIDIARDRENRPLRCADPVPVSRKSVAIGGTEMILDAETMAVEGGRISNLVEPDRREVRGVVLEPLELLQTQRLHRIERTVGKHRPPKQIDQKIQERGHMLAGNRGRDPLVVRVCDHGTPRADAIQRIREFTTVA